MKSGNKMIADLDRALSHARKLHGDLTVMFENLQAIHHALRGDIEEIHRLRKSGALKKPEETKV